MSETKSRTKQIFVSRIEKLLESVRESDSISHQPTKGALREAYLRELMNDLLPSSMSVRSGFICDAFGGITPQIDFVIAEKNKLSPILLMNDVSLVPVESAIIAIEVKSVLNDDAIKQIRTQMDKCNNLRRTYTLKQNQKPPEKTPFLPVYFSIVALESKTKKERIASWFRDMPTLLNVCVIGKFGVKRSDYEKPDATIVEGQDHIESLNYFSTLIEHFYNNLDYRREVLGQSGYERVWIPYLLGPEQV